MSKEVYMVDLGIGRSRMSIAIESEWLGIDLNSAEKKAFFEEHVELGKFHIMPKSKEKELQNFEQKVRMAFRRTAIPYKLGGNPIHFMTKKQYEMYKEAFKVYEKEYFNILNEILEQYDDIVNGFISMFEQTISKKKDREKFVKQMKEQIPLKDFFEESFYINFEQAMSVDLDKNPKIASKFLGRCLAISYKLANMIEETLKKNSVIPNKTLGAIRKNMELIADANIADHPKINEILKSFQMIYDLKGVGKGLNTKALVQKIKRETVSFAEELGTTDMIEF